MKRSLLEVLKDLSAILVGAAAVLYIFGFMVHWAYFRLIGVEMLGQPFDYLRFAADYATSIASSLPQLLLKSSLYAPRLLQSSLRAITFCCSVILLAAPTLYIWRKNPDRFVVNIKKRQFALFTVLWWILSLTTILSMFLLVRLEFGVTTVRNVLQPIDAAHIQEMQSQVKDATDFNNSALLELRSKNVVRVYDHYSKTQTDSPGFSNLNKWFNPTINPYSSAERLETYLALLLLNLITLLATIYQLWFLTSIRIGRNLDEAIATRVGVGSSRILIGALSAGLLFQLLLFPFVYAGLGRHFVYPIVRLKLVPEAEASNQSPKEATTKPAGSGPVDRLAEPPTDRWTHCVYLVAQVDNEVIVYDRLNFFQVKHIPRTRLISMTELFTASPFESCSKEEDTFVPCETLWVPKETPILDF